MAIPRLVRLRAARKRVKKQPRAVRWARSPQTPRAVELTYVIALKKLAARWGDRAKELLLPIAKRTIKPADDTRTDAPGDSYSAALKSLGSYGSAYADGTEFATAQISTGKKAVAHSKGEFQRLGIKLREAEPNLDKGIREWRSTNVDLVKSMLDGQREILSDILTGYEGHSYETIAKQIAERCDVASSRAEFLARDQVLKLNSNITTARMGAAGIAEFIWTTTGDERVRPMHEALDGQQFSFDDPPVTNDDGDANLPGEDYQCRCVPTPVIPEFDDDASNDNAEPPPEDAPEQSGKAYETNEREAEEPRQEFVPFIPHGPIEAAERVAQVERAEYFAAVAEKAPAVAPEAPKAKPLDILARKVGVAAGSNPGGVYEGSDGVRRYVKFYSDKAQAVGEHLANSLYSDLGLGGVKSTVFAHEGGLAYASEILPDVQTLGSKFTKPLAKKALDGFAADVLTANWDAAGLNLDNMLVDAKGDITRIDNGGSFLNRAQGARKPPHLLESVTEWQSFFDPNKNAAYARIAAKAGVTGPADLATSIKKSVKNITKVRDDAGGWAKYVEARAEGLSADDRKSIIGMLDARTEFLQKRVAEMGVVPVSAPLPVAAPNVTKAQSAGAKAAATRAANKAAKAATETTAVSAPPVPITQAELDVGRARYFELEGKSTTFLKGHEGFDSLVQYTGTQYKRMNKLLMAPVSRKAVGYVSPYAAAEKAELMAKIKQAHKALLDAKANGLAVDGAVHRGIHVSDTTLKSFHKDEIHVWKNFGSTSVSEETAWDFTSPEPGRENRVMYRVRQRSAIPVKGVSLSGGENEAMLPPGSRFRVISRTQETWPHYNGPIKFTRIEIEEL